MEKQLTASNKEINRIMALNKMFTRRGAVAVAAGTALVFGTAACSEAEDAKDNTTSAAQDATDAAGDDGNKATDAAGSAANDATEAAGDASQDVKDLPEDIKAAWENTGGANGELGAGSPCSDVVHAVRRAPARMRPAGTEKRFMGTSLQTRVEILARI